MALPLLSLQDSTVEDLLVPDWSAPNGAPVSNNRLPVAPPRDGSTIQPYLENLITNPSVETNTTNWTTMNTFSTSRDESYSGETSLRALYRGSDLLLRYTHTLAQTGKHNIGVSVYIPSSWSGGPIKLTARKLVNLTLSGNEITDTTRTTNTQGDGLTPPHSSFGIWEGTTNLIPNGGGETALTGFQNNNLMAPVSRDTTQGKFGTCSFRGVGTGSGVHSVEWRDLVGARIAATAATPYSFSLWCKADAVYGRSPLLQILWHDAGGSILATTSGTAALVNTTWTRLTVSATAPANTASVRISWRNPTGVTGEGWNFDGVQFEAKPIPTPYVETSAGTASRTAARVQLPADRSDETQGWFAALVRAEWIATADPSNGASTRLAIASWSDASNSRVLLGYNVSSDKWEMLRETVSGIDPVLSVTQTFVIGDLILVIGYWTTSLVGISVNGSTFTTAASTHIPTLSSTTIDVGRRNDTAAQYLDMTLHWFMCGTGVLTNADATTLYALGIHEPDYDTLPDAAQVTAIVSFDIGVYWHPITVKPDTSASLTDQWQRLNVVLDAVTAEQIVIDVRNTASTPDLNDAIYVDGLSLIRDELPHGYFDGDAPGGWWTGTRHASSSRSPKTLIGDPPPVDWYIDDVAYELVNP